MLHDEAPLVHGGEAVAHALVQAAVLQLRGGQGLLQPLANGDVVHEELHGHGPALGVAQEHAALVHPLAVALGVEDLVLVLRPDDAPPVFLHPFLDGVLPLRGHSAQGLGVAPVELLWRVAQHALHAGAHVLPAHGGQVDAEEHLVGPALGELAEALLALAQGLARVAFLGDVAEGELHHQVLAGLARLDGAHLLDPDGPAVLAHQLEVEAWPRNAPAQLVQPGVGLLPPLRGHHAQAQAGVVVELLRGVAQHALHARAHVLVAPGVQVHGEHHLVRPGLDELPEVRLAGAQGLSGAALLGDVAHGEQRRQVAPGRAGQQHARLVHPDRAAVLAQHLVLVAGPDDALAVLLHPGPHLLPPVRGHQGQAQAGVVAEVVRGVAQQVLHAGAHVLVVPGGRVQREGHVVRPGLDEQAEAGLALAQGLAGVALLGLVVAHALQQHAPAVRRGGQRQPLLDPADVPLAVQHGELVAVAHLPGGDLRKPAPDGGVPVLGYAAQHGAGVVVELLRGMAAQLGDARVDVLVHALGEAHGEEDVAGVLGQQAEARLVLAQVPLGLAQLGDVRGHALHEHAPAIGRGHQHLALQQPAPAALAVQDLILVRGLHVAPADLLHPPGHLVAPPGRDDREHHAQGVVVVLLGRVARQRAVGGAGVLEAELRQADDEEQVRGAVGHEPQQALALAQGLAGLHHLGGVAAVADDHAGAAVGPAQHAEVVLDVPPGALAGAGAVAGGVLRQLGVAAGVQHLVHDAPHALAVVGVHVLHVLGKNEAPLQEVRRQAQPARKGRGGVEHARLGQGHGVDGVPGSVEHQAQDVRGDLLRPPRAALSFRHARPPSASVCPVRHVAHPGRICIREKTARPPHFPP